MNPRVVVPITLGCCPDSPRCLLCPPPPRVGPDLVRALVQHYRDQHGPDVALDVRFFGGAPPGDDLLAAAAPHPIVARVRPDLLSRADARRLYDHGTTGIELDLLTRHGPALAAIGRHHRAPLVDEMVRGLRELGMEVGGVLTPGLPGSSHATSLEDAQWAATHLSFVRIHPVLVLARSGLRALHEAGRYEPMDLGQAVTVCRDMLDILEPAGVDVIRVGLQPGPDGFGRAVAGPRHTSLRELVEARRALDRLKALLVDVRPGASVIVRCAPPDETRVRGMYNGNVRTLRAAFELQALTITPDPTLPRGDLRVDVSLDPS